MKSYQIHIRVATKAVVKAARLCRSVQENLVSDDSLAKKDRSPVTVADFGAQAIISHELWLEFPNIPLVGEEDSSQLIKPENKVLKDSVISNVQRVNPDLNQDAILQAINRGIYTGSSKGCHWCLDPIDGTKGFLRKDQYAIALALIEDGEVVLGILACPNLPERLSESAHNYGCIFKAAKGQGASMAVISDDGGISAWRSINVDKIAAPSEAIFCESYESGHSSHSDSDKVRSLLSIETPSVRIDSQCKYALVARGDASFYLRLPTTPGGRENQNRYIEKIWDHAAGVIVIEEAGGKVTDIYGKKLDFSLGRTLDNNVGVIVTNGLLHDIVLEAVQKVLKVN